MELCFATNNAHKLAEISEKVGSRISIRSLKDIGFNQELPETADTLEGNARQKAWGLYDAKKVNCFADDTGLEVEALDGAPGVYSARYAGPDRIDEDNVDLLLENLSGEDNRKARFRTVICLIINQQEYLFEGIAEGSITRSPAGYGGFGYDPVFRPWGYEGTFAEMGLSEKNKISHRAKAVDKLVDFLKTQYS